MNKTLPYLLAVALLGAVAIPWTWSQGAGDPASTRDRHAASPVATRAPAARTSTAADNVQRTPAPPLVEPDAPPAADAPNHLYTLTELPEDLRQKARDAVRHCRFSNEKLGVEWPRGRPMLTIEGAERIIAAEKALQDEILAFSVAEQNVLVNRMAAAPTTGVVIPTADPDGPDDELRAMYPGWPDGYVFASIDNGIEIRTACWKVAGDPELEALQRDGNALRGDYARVVRSTYRRDLVFE